MLVRPAPLRDNGQVAIAPKTLLTLVLFGAGVFVLGELVLAIRQTLIQLVLAIVFAMALEPVVRSFQGRGLSRGRAIAVTFALAAVVLTGFAYLLFAPLVDQLNRFANDLPALLRELTHGHGPLGFLERRYHVVEQARSAVQGNGLGGTAGATLGVVGDAVRTGGAVVFVAFLTLFVQLGGRDWFASIVRMAPAARRESIHRAGDGIAAAVGGYVTGNLLLSIIAGTVATVVLFATGVPYAVPLGLLVAIFDLIPMVGATAATVIVGAVALTQGVTPALIVVVTMVLYQQVENHSLQQLVYHRTVQLSPLAIAVSVAAGAELGGVVGALLGIPVAGAIKVVAAEFVRPAD